VDGTIRGIAISDSDLYWVEFGMGRGIVHMPKLGASQPVLLHRLDVGTTTAFDVAVDRTFVYWGDENQIWQIPVSGNVSTSPFSYFSTGSQIPRYIAVERAVPGVDANAFDPSQADVYVTTAGASIIYGTLGTSFIRYIEQPGIAGVAIYSPRGDAGGHDLLWGYGKGIKEGPLQGGGGIDITTSGLPVEGVATDGRFIYWIENGQEIKSFEPTTSAAPRRLCFDALQDLGTDGDIAVDDAWVYFTWPKKNQILKCPK